MATDAEQKKQIGTSKNIKKLSKDSLLIEIDNKAEIKIY